MFMFTISSTAYSIPLGHETPTLGSPFTRGPFPVEIGPLQHDDVDIGDPTPVRRLKNGLWLSKDRDLTFTLLLSPAMQHGRVGGVHVELAVPEGERGLQFSQTFFRDLESRVNTGGKGYPSKATTSTLAEGVL
jgi:hypothetical protein